MHIACVGNAILDTLVAFAPSDLETYVQDGKLVLPLGEKILVASSQLELGGNAANVSVGLSRLGYQTSLFAEVGDDLLGNFIQQSLAKDQVDTSGMKKSGKTAMDISVNAKVDRVILVDHQMRLNEFELPFDTLDGVYLTSLGNNWQKVYEYVTQARARKDFMLACNPGSVQLKEIDTFLPFLKQIDLLCINVQEAGVLTGMTETLQKGKDREKTRMHIKELCEKLFSLGVKIVVITDGIAGSYAATSEERKILFCPTFSTPIVELTGAGDGFATGFLASYLTTRSLEDGLLSGTANGSSVVEYVGAQMGLLTPEKMEERKKLAETPIETI
jgi:ribokinase